MGNFFKSLFSSSKEEKAENGADNTVSKADHKKFDVFKYDGIRAQRMGQLPYAIKCFEEALAIQDDYEAMGHLVNAYLAAHNFEEALELTNRMVALEPEEVSSYMARINVLFMMDKEQEAIADCLRVIELDETSFAAWYMMGKAKQSTKEYTGAIADLTKTIELKEDFTNAWLLRAEVLLETTQPEKALQDIEKAIELAPEEESAYLLRGRIHEAMGDFAAATDDYNQALALNPFNEEASLLSASLLIKENRIEEAITLLDDMIDLKPDLAKAYAERAKAHELKGDQASAQADRQKAEELKDEDAHPSEGGQTNFDNMYKGGIY